MHHHTPPLHLGDWPDLEWSEWKETAETLHLYSQVVGKTRLALTPTQNHWWNVPLYITAHGLGTSAIPISGGHLLEIEFDFLHGELVLRTSAGDVRRLELTATPIAEFYQRYLGELDALNVNVNIDPTPVEIPNPIRFDEDTVQRSYDADAAKRFWHALRLADTLLKRFSTAYYGKISPVHFFWGSFDLAVTRFNGNRALARSGSDAIQSEAYSHEVISAGFWPGNGGYGQAAFYAYAAPVPRGLAETALQGAGRFDQKLGEFILDYDDVRGSANPAATVLTFLQETYAAAADAGGWNRPSLERIDAVGTSAIRADLP